MTMLLRSTGTDMQQHLTIAHNCYTSDAYSKPADCAWHDTLHSSFAEEQIPCGIIGAAVLVPHAHGSSCWAGI